MSDQPQKKPGSLRDRIAAFEKSSASPSAAQPPPPPRPKPAGFANWKPKQPSPPSSPQVNVGSADHATVSSSGMSASDARDSITKGASLRERMAALQNKGAFGAPPPVAPKPAAERPKWKPPPVVQAPDPENASSEGPGGITTAIERTTSPTPIKSQANIVEGEDGTQPTDIPTGASDTNVEEERQRRAAIAARMARLGGARLGMAPPIIGKKPVRRSTQEELEATEDKKFHSSQDVNPDSAARPNSPSIEPANIAPPPSDFEGPLPTRRSSEGTTSDIHSPKPPTSMPVPAVPRRAGPPRKKSAKATVPEVEIPNQEPPIASSTVNKVKESASPSEDSKVDQTSVIPQAEQKSDDKVEEIHMPSATLKTEPADEAKVVTKSKSSDLPGGALSALESAFSEIRLPSHATENTKEGDGWEGQSQILSSSSTPARNTGFEADKAETDESIHKELLAENLGVASPVTPSPYEGAHIDVARSEHDYDSDDADEFDIDVPSADSSNQLPPNILPIDHLVDLSSPESRRVEVPSSPRRSVHVQQSRRIVAEEEGEKSDEEADELLAQSHLFIPPPRDRIALHPLHQNIQDEDDGAGDGSENDTPPLPVPHRHSIDTAASRSILAPQSDNESDPDPDSDHDGQALPVPPRPRPSRTMPPAPAEEFSQYEGGSSLVPAHPSFSIETEVMDENEGDPIDPEFHGPSRRASYMSLNATAVAQPVSQSDPLLAPPASTPSRPVSQPLLISPPVSPPSARNLSEPSEDNAKESEGDDVESRKRTIAERMARLGGIKFGAYPVHKSPTALQPGQTDETDAVPAGKGDCVDDTNEEKDERERKERIAAKLAQMGGMRIGMMPVGIGGVIAPRQKTQEEPMFADPSPGLPSRPPPPVPAHELESRSGDVSDDGVKVEAEESEVEEVNYQDAEQEEVPPPIPSRSTRPVRRQDSSEIAVSPLLPSRPPVPVVPPRRSSSLIEPVKAPVSPRRKASTPTTQSDYVLVEPGPTESPELPLPARPVSQAPPTRHIPDFPKMDESHESISSQWELPSIPTANLDFEGSTDLSLSWTDAGMSVSPDIPAQPLTIRASKARSPRSSGMEPAMSADDLISVWGRVGVQVCEVATALFEKSKKTLIGDGSYAGFVKAVLKEVPNAAEVAVDSGEYGYLVYYQNGSVVQKRASEIMPGDIIEVHDARFKGHKGLQVYQQSVGGSGELVTGIVGEYDVKKLKVKVFQANQHVGQQTVESVSYRLEDLKSGTVKIYRVLEA